MINVKLFKRIYDRITAEPRSLDMNTWEDHDSSCGTTRCVAGWAIFDETGEHLFNPDDTLHVSVIRLADELDIDIDRIPSDVIEDVATSLLGLDEDTAHELFHCRGYMACGAVELFANGREAEALALLADEEVDDSGYTP